MEKAPKVEVPSRLGRKGAGYTAMRPTLAPLHTFAPNAMTGPTPPPLEIYGVSRTANNADDVMVPSCVSPSMPLPPLSPVAFQQCAKQSLLPSRVIFVFLY